MIPLAEPGTPCSHHIAGLPDPRGRSRSLPTSEQRVFPQSCLRSCRQPRHEQRDLRTAEARGQVPRAYRPPDVAKDPAPNTRARDSLQVPESRKGRKIAPYDVIRFKVNTAITPRCSRLICSFRKGGPGKSYRLSRRDTRFNRG